MEWYLNALERELEDGEKEYDPVLCEVQASCMLMSYGGNREIFDIAPTPEHFDVLALAVEICVIASKNDINLGGICYCRKLLSIMSIVNVEANVQMANMSGSNLAAPALT